MRRALKTATLVVLLAPFAASTPAQTPSLPATDVTNAQIQATVKKAIAENRTDQTIRMVDAGAYNLGVGVVYRPKGKPNSTGISHNGVAEVYQVVEGVGTLVTGGTLVNPKAQGGPDSANGPSIGGTSIQGGVSRRVAKGDMVIIPAGTPHVFVNVEEPIIYTVVRVDHSRAVNLR